MIMLEELFVARVLLLLLLLLFFGGGVFLMESAFQECKFCPDETLLALNVEFVLEPSCYV